MPTIALQPHSYLSVSFSADTDDDLQFVVEAEDPVPVYVVDTRNLSQFQNDEDFDYYGPNKPRRRHDFSVTIPHAGRWYLILMNEHPSFLAVHYDIYE